METFGHLTAQVRKPCVIISSDLEGVSVRSLLSAKRPVRKGPECP